MDILRLYMVKRDTHHTLTKESDEYLKQFANQSKIIDEALQLHRNKDKIIEIESPKQKYEVKWN